MFPTLLLVVQYLVVVISECIEIQCIAFLFSPKLKINTGIALDETVP